MELTAADVQRDIVEQQLAEEAQKPEIYFEVRQGLEIRVYLLRKLGEVSMSLTRGGQLREFIIPNTEVMEAIAHPEWYAYRAGLPEEIKSE